MSALQGVTQTTTILDFLGCIRVSEEGDGCIEDDDGAGKVSSYYQTPLENEEEDDATPTPGNQEDRPQVKTDPTTALVSVKPSGFVLTGKLPKSNVKFQKEVNVSAYLEGLRRCVQLALQDNLKAFGRRAVQQNGNMGQLEELSEKAQQLKKLVISYDYQAPSKEEQILRDNEVAKSQNTHVQLVSRLHAGAATHKGQGVWLKELKDAYEALTQRYLQIHDIKDPAQVVDANTLWLRPQECVGIVSQNKSVTLTQEVLWFFHSSAFPPPQNKGGNSRNDLGSKKKQQVYQPTPLKRVFDRRLLKEGSNGSSLAINTNAARNNPLAMPVIRIEEGESQFHPDFLRMGAPPIKTDQYELYFRTNPGSLAEIQQTPLKGQQNQAQGLNLSVQRQFVAAVQFQLDSMSKTQSSFAENLKRSTIKSSPTKQAQPMRSESMQYGGFSGSNKLNNPSFNKMANIRKQYEIHNGVQQVKKHKALKPLNTGQKKRESKPFSDTSPAIFEEDTSFFASTQNFACADNPQGPEGASQSPINYEIEDALRQHSFTDSNYKFYQGYDDFGTYQSDRLQQSIYGTAQRIPNMSELISLNDIIRTEQILGDRLESVEAEQRKLRQYTASGVACSPTAHQKTYSKHNSGLDLNLYLMTLEKLGPVGNFGLAASILENSSGGQHKPLVVQAVSATTQYKGSSKLRFGLGKQPNAGGHRTHGEAKQVAYKKPDIDQTEPNGSGGSISKNGGRLPQSSTTQPPVANALKPELGGGNYTPQYQQKARHQYPLGSLDGASGTDETGKDLIQGGKHSPELEDSAEQRNPDTIIDDPIEIVLTKQLLEEHRKQVGSKLDSQSSLVLRQNREAFRWNADFEGFSDSFSPSTAAVGSPQTSLLARYISTIAGQGRVAAPDTGVRKQSKQNSEIQESEPLSTQAHQHNDARSSFKQELLQKYTQSNLGYRASTQIVGGRRHVNPHLNLQDTAPNGNLQTPTKLTAAVHQRREAPVDYSESADGAGGGVPVGCSGGLRQPDGQHTGIGQHSESDQGQIGITTKSHQTLQSLKELCKQPQAPTRLGSNHYYHQGKPGQEENTGHLQGVFLREERPSATQMMSRVKVIGGNREESKTSLLSYGIIPGSEVGSYQSPNQRHKYSFNPPRHPTHTPYLQRRQQKTSNLSGKLGSTHSSGHIPQILKTGHKPTSFLEKNQTAMFSENIKYDMFSSTAQKVGVLDGRRISFDKHINRVAPHAQNLLDRK